MFGAVIDTAIGLVLVFLLFSIVLSTLIEAISGALSLRAKAFENAIANLIANPVNVRKGFVLGGRLTAMFGAHKRAAITGMATARAANAPCADYTKVYCHALVAGIGGTSRPSYVPAANFASAVIDELNGSNVAGAVQAVKDNIAALPDGDFKQTLSALMLQAGDNLDKLRTGIEGWYDSAMDRVSGDYKRFSQVITLILGLVIAAACNVDAIHVGQSLYADPTQRAVIEAAAEKQVAQAPPGDAANATFGDVTTARDQLIQLGPIGWTDRTMSSSDAGRDVSVVFGWLLTTLAGMMGAPFWFDTLKSLVNVRNAGPKPTSSTSDDK